MGRPTNEEVAERDRKVRAYDEFMKLRFPEQMQVYDIMKGDVLSLSEARRRARRMQIAFLVPVFDGRD
jgi:hypothetical protein